MAEYQETHAQKIKEFEIYCNLICSEDGIPDENDDDDPGYQDRTEQEVISDELEKE